MDGYTKKGSYKVTLELTGDMLEQLVRLIGLAKIIDGRRLNLDKVTPEPLDVVAYREFLEDILHILYEAIGEHPRVKPTDT